MKRKHLLLFLLSFALITWLGIRYSGWHSLPEDPPLPQLQGITDTNYRAEIEEARAYLQKIPDILHVPSFSVAVAQSGKVIWSEAIGYANIAAQKPATPNTQYRIGSTSKAVTATGVARLVERGLLNLDDSVGHRIPNFPPKRWNFTTRQLLSHTAGIGNYEDFIGVYSAFTTLCNCRQFNTVTEGLDVFNDFELLFQPGTDFKYSSFDIILASAVIEETSGAPFLKYMNQEIFYPLGMSATLGDHSGPAPHLATFYESDGSRFREWRSFGLYPNDINLSYKWAGGGFLSTPSDIVKLGSAWLTDSTFIQPATRRIFFTPQTLSDSSVNEQRYALGWRSYDDYQSKDLLNGEEEVWIVHHGGVSKGSMNLLVLFPKYELVINASINARAAEFSDFWREVMVLAGKFLGGITPRPSATSAAVSSG